MPKTLAFSSSRSFVHNFYETRLSLKTLDDEAPYKLSYFDLSHFAYYCTRKEGGRNRNRSFSFVFKNTCGTVLIFFSVHSVFLLNCRKTCKETLHVITYSDFVEKVSKMVAVRGHGFAPNQSLD